CRDRAEFRDQERDVGRIRRESAVIRRSIFPHHSADTPSANPPYKQHDGSPMKQLKVGDVTITSIIERDGPWRKPEDMFVGYDPEVGKRHLKELDAEVYDWASGRMVITYQTFVVRTPKHTVLVDTCTGEDKGYPPPFDFPKQPWLDGFAAAGLRVEDIDYVF